MNKLQLCVRNLGPIKGGLVDNDGFIDFPKVTLFCGPQGSGKSTVAKVVSSLQWLEKKLYATSINLRSAALTRDKLLSALKWQGLDAYLSSNTFIYYKGSVFDFILQNGKVEIKVHELESSKYVKPQIMYMPAERNFASIISKSVAVGPLPPPLVALQIEFEKAEIFFQGKNYKLPSNGYSFIYDKEGAAWIENTSESELARTRLREASSGLQSIVPLLLVSDYLARDLTAKSNKVFGRLLGYDVSAEKYFTYQKQLQQILGSRLADKQKFDILTRLLGPNECFVNIVEEPEQNLFPSTQQEVTRYLFKLANKHENRLIMSTHSPFVVNEMVFSAKASQLCALARKQEATQEVLKRIDRLYPTLSAVSENCMALYELDEKGFMRRLPTEGGVISDSNLINAALDDWSYNFDNMMQMEAELNG